MAVTETQIAAQALKAWLLLKLPAKVTAVNALRAASFTTPAAGPFTIPSGAILRVGVTRDTFSACPLTPGAARTAAQLAADVNAVVASAGSADSEGRFVLTSTAAPVAGTPSVIAVGADNAGAGGASTGANAALGWSDGGEHAVASALVAPTFRSVLDGWPVTPDFGKCLAIVIGDRSATPLLPLHRHESHVLLDLVLLWPDPLVSRHRSREAIESCLRCVREVLFSDAGRQLGRAAIGDIIITEEVGAQVPAVPIAFQAQGASPLFDTATLTLRVRVYEVPATT